jgi:hypothetical protein
VRDLRDGRFDVVPPEMASLRMKVMQRRLLRALAAIALLASATPVAAQINIGEMADVVGAVTGVSGARRYALRNGDGVVENQTVATAPASTARIAFHDLSTLSLGPSSSVRLDRFVYAPSGTTAAAVLRVGRGAFRFVTGNSHARDISIRTPSALIGLRGTTIDMEVRVGREIVWLRKGAVQVCRGPQCVTLDEPGTGVFITARGVSPPSTAPQLIFDYDRMTSERFRLFGPDR